MVEEIHVELPPFFCPVEPVMHPDLASTARRSAEWAVRLHLVRTDAELARWMDSGAADFYGGMVPGASAERYQLAVDWCYWAFSFDDSYCDQGSNATSTERIVAVTGRVLRLLESRDERLCAANRALLGLCDLARRYRRLSTPTQYERWVDAQRRWLLGVVQQVDHRAREETLCLDDYLRTRLHEAGGPPVQAMLEFADDVEVPAHEMDSEPVRVVNELFWMVASLDNDLVSRHRESVQQSANYNAVEVLAQDRSLSVPEAEREIVKLRDRMMVLFLRVRENLAATASKPLLVYLDALRHGIRANIDWSLRTPRYTRLRPSAEHPDGVTLRLHTRWVDEPADASSEAPPLPSIAWWWDAVS